MRAIRGTFALLCALTALPVLAQNSVTLQSFRMEYPVRSTVLIPPEIVQAVENGDVEMRQQIRYNGQGHYLEVLAFPVPVGAVSLTPNEAIPCDLPERFRVDITDATLSGNTVSLLGIVAAGANAPVSAVSRGDLYSLEMNFVVFGQFHSALFSNIRFTTGAVGRIPAAVGRLVTSAVATKPPTATATLNVITSQPEVQLDATRSADPDSALPLEFDWRSTFAPAVIRGCHSPNPTVQLSAGPGAYRFALTVTDADGLTAETAVTVTYYGRF